MALFYASNDDLRILAQVNEACDVVEQQTGMVCSEHSRALISNALTAIVADPSPEWRERDNAERRSAVLGQQIQQLPQLVRRMAVEAGSDQQITYYQVLHWLTRNLDGICPFEKTPRRLRRG